MGGDEGLIWGGGEGEVIQGGGGGVGGRSLVQVGKLLNLTINN